VKIDVVIVTALISAFSSSGVMSLVIYLLQRRDRRREKEEAKESAQSKMLVALGHDKIIYLSGKYVRRGCITVKEKGNLEMLAQPYFEAGGNGDGKIGYEACQKLKIVSEDEAEKIDIETRRKEFMYEDEQ